MSHQVCCPARFRVVLGVTNFNFSTFPSAATSAPNLQRRSGRQPDLITVDLLWKITSTGQWTLPPRPQDVHDSSCSLAFSRFKDSNRIICYHLTKVQEFFSYVTISEFDRFSSHCATQVTDKATFHRVPCVSISRANYKKRCPTFVCLPVQPTSFPSFVTVPSEVSCMRFMP